MCARVKQAVMPASHLALSAALLFRFALDLGRWGLLAAAGQDEKRKHQHNGSGGDDDGLFVL